MPTYFPIGLGAGLAAAVLFASASAGPLAALLFLLAPLPTFLAGLGWGWLAALVAALVSALLIGAMTSAKVALAYMASQSLPVVLLCYLAYLNRPAHEGADRTAVEWYPVGRMLAVAAALAGALAVVTLMLKGGDLEQLRKELRDVIEQALRQMGPPSEGKSMPEGAIAYVAGLAPYTLPATWLGYLLFNFWLAGRITLASGRLLRPWPDLSALRLPQGAPLLLAGAAALTFFDGLPGYIGASFTGPLVAAYNLVGLAVVHHVTRGSPWRSFVLAALYAGVVLIFMWGALAVAIVGLAEPFSPLRRNLPPAPGGS